MVRMFVLWGMLLLGMITAQAQELPPTCLFQIDVTPRATLTLNYKVIGMSSEFRQELKAPQTVLMKLSAPGYVTHYEAVPMSVGGRVYRNVKLRPQAIPVYFNSNVEGTAIYMGREELGPTPLPTFFEKPGDYMITAKAEGYKTQTFKLNLRDGMPRMEFVKMVSEWGGVTVTSEPSGAEIFINGKSQGHTPKTFDNRKEGGLRFSLQLAGYKPATRDVTVVAGETTDVNVKLEPQPATLRVVSVPTGARVYLNDIYRDVTDFRDNDMKPGIYTVRVEYDGYLTESRKIELKPGAFDTHEFKLKSNAGQLVLQLYPAVVDVWVDGKKTLTTVARSSDATISEPAILTLTPGSHTLRFRAKGAKEETRVVDVKAFETRPYKVKLAWAPSVRLKTASGVHEGNIIKRDKDKGTLTLETRYGLLPIYESDILGITYLYDEAETH